MNERGIGGGWEQTYTTEGKGHPKQRKLYASTSCGKISASGNKDLEAIIGYERYELSPRV